MFVAFSNGFSNPHSISTNFGTKSSRLVSTCFFDIEPGLLELFENAPFFTHCIVMLSCCLTGEGTLCAQLEVRCN